MGNMKYRYKVTTNNSGTTISQQDISTLYDIPNILYHFDTTGLVSNNANTFGTVDISNKVSRLNNLVPSSTNHLTQSTSGYQPTLVGSGVTFNGNGNLFTFDSKFDLYYSTIIIIYNPRLTITTSSLAQHFLAYNTGEVHSSQLHLGGSKTLSIYDYVSPGTGDYELSTYSTTTINNNLHKFAVYSNDYVTMEVDDVSIGPLTDILNRSYRRIKPGQGTLLNVKYFGARFDNVARCLDGTFYEMMIFNREINDAEKQYITTYIKNKYNI